MIARVLTLISCWLAVTAYAAEPYPIRPLRIIVPYPPGATTDFVARLMAQRLNDALAQPVIVENRGGAGGIIAAELAARAAPDGYTLFFGTPAALCISPAVQAKVPYDTLRDFAPISQLAALPQILIAAASFAPNSTAELVQLARSRPGQLSYASVGIGSPQHLGIELLKARAGIDMVHVPYKGGAAATTDLIGGRVQVYMGSIPSLMPHVKSGKLKVLGIASSARSAVLPNVPTIAEHVPGYEFVGTWYGLLTQSRVNPTIVTRLNAAIVAALQMPEVRQQLIQQGADPRPTTAEEFAAFVRKDCPSWARAVKAANLRPE